MTKEIKREFGLRSDGSIGEIHKRRSILERLRDIPGSVGNVLLALVLYGVILSSYLTLDHPFGIPGGDLAPALIILAVIVGFFARSFRDVFLKRGGLLLLAHVTLVVVYNVWYFLSPIVFAAMTFGFLFLLPVYLSAPFISGAIYLISMAGLAAWYFTEGEAFKFS